MSMLSSTITLPTQALTLLRNVVSFRDDPIPSDFMLMMDAVSSNGKFTDCYLGLLYALEDVAVYGYITPPKVKIILALGLTDTVIKDAEVNMVCMPCPVFTSSANFNRCRFSKHCTWPTIPPSQIHSSS
jgi:hypothetical protein